VKRTPDFIRALPKAELHVHIEGTLEPELVFALAAKHGIELPYHSAAELRAAYSFADLQSFLDIYYTAANVLRERERHIALLEQELATKDRWLDKSQADLAADPLAVRAINDRDSGAAHALDDGAHGMISSLTSRAIAEAIIAPANV